MATTSKERILDIARIVYGATRIYGHFSDDVWEPSWEEICGSDRAAVIAGVEAVVSGNANSPEELHAAKVQAQFGVARQFETLSVEQRQRTELFRAMVLALIDGPCTNDCHDRACPKPYPHACHLDTCLSEFGVRRTETAG